MESVIKLYWELRSIAGNNGDEVARTLSVVPNEDPAAFFNMAFNNISFTLELLDHYHNLFSKQTTTRCSSVEEARAENAQRIIHFQKMGFIEIMSAIEFAAKKVVREKTATFGTFPKKIYLSTIMQRSFDKDLITEADLNLWKGAIRLRNSLVHNNGISYETACYKYPDVTVHVNSNEMTQGKLDFFGLVTKWLLDSSMVWILRAHGH